MCEERGDGQSHEEADVHVAVSVLADEDDRHRIEGNSNQESAANDVATRPGPNEGEVERHQERRLDEHEVEAQRGEERQPGDVCDGVEGNDGHEPEWGPVQNSGLVRIAALLERLERALLPVVDVEGMCVADHGDEQQPRQPGGREDDGEISRAGAEESGHRGASL